MSRILKSRFWLSLGIAVVAAAISIPAIAFGSGGGGGGDGKATASANAKAAATLRGPRGKRGKRGPRGFTGAQGPKGDPGTAGAAGQAGAAGAAGATGATGPSSVVRTGLVKIGQGDARTLLSTGPIDVQLSCVDASGTSVEAIISVATVRDDGTLAAGPSGNNFTSVHDNDFTASDGRVSIIDITDDTDNTTFV